MTSSTVGVLHEFRWSENVASRLVELHRGGGGAVVTWLNHVSVQQAVQGAVDLAAFDLIGIDGFFLRRIVSPDAPRTSADLVLPLVLARLGEGAKVALVGGLPERLEAARETVEGLPSSPSVVYLRDGYDGLPTPGALAEELREADVDVVIIGLGAPRQDHYAAALARDGLTGVLVFTCGGWLDQFSNPTYYPAFAYRYKLNWLVRLVREPSRLWRRYSVDALRALSQRRALRLVFRTDCAAALTAMTALCSVEPAESAGTVPAPRQP